MTETLPDPLVPADVDITGFPYMPLYIERLRKSKAWLICRRNPEFAFYMLNLWMRAYHERPAASIEDDQDVLADAAGCAPARWDEIGEQVMRGWVLCSDGRWYHPTISELALEAWDQRLKVRWKMYCDRMRKENHKRGPDKEKHDPVLDFEQWRITFGSSESTGKQATGDGKPTEKRKIPLEKSEIPPEKPLEVNGSERKGSERKVNPINTSCAETEKPAQATTTEALTLDGGSAPAPTEITMPLNDGTEHPVTTAQADEWQTLYPGINVRQQLRAMRGWLLADRKRRKTKSGINRFINGWLSREQDSASAKGQQSTNNGRSIQHERAANIAALTGRNRASEGTGRIFDQD